jgi:hypothetical protein
LAEVLVVVVVVGLAPVDFLDFALDALTVTADRALWPVAADAAVVGRASAATVNSAPARILCECRMVLR